MSLKGQRIVTKKHRIPVENYEWGINKRANLISL